MRNLNLRRGQLLEMVDMTARPFDSMLMRGQAPWSPRDTGRQWGEFTTEDAYRVALVHALIRQGRPYDEAGRTIRGIFGELSKYKSDAPGNLLLGTLMTETLPNEEPGVRLHLPFIAAETEWFGELARMKNAVADGDELIAFSAIDATAIMKRTLAKADAAGLKDDRLVKLARKVRAV